MMHATTNEPVPLRVVTSDGITTLFGRAYIYSSAILIDTIDLPHIADGMYGASYVPTDDGYLSVIYKLFTDAGHTILGPYGVEAETIEVNSIKTNILRLLGLLHHNSVIDQQIYNISGSMTSSRIRSYDSPTNAIAAGLTGLLHTWFVEVEYAGAFVSKFTIVEDL